MAPRKAPTTPIYHAASMRVASPFLVVDVVVVSVEMTREVKLEVGVVMVPVSVEVVVPVILPLMPVLVLAKVAVVLVPLLGGRVLAPTLEVGTLEEVGLALRGKLGLRAYTVFTSDTPTKAM